VAGPSDSNFVLARYNTNGSLDTTFDSISSLNNTPSYAENAAPVLLDSTTSIYDYELAVLNSGNGNYSGAGVTLTRHGGASTQNVFFASGNLVFSVGNTGSQGTGGALMGTGSTTVNIVDTVAAPTALDLAIASDTGLSNGYQRGGTLESDNQWK
jgi:hypothetical protein